MKYIIDSDDVLGIIDMIRDVKKMIMIINAYLPKKLRKLDFEVFDNFINKLKNLEIYSN